MSAISEEDYIRYLRLANSSESKFPTKTLEYLEICLKIVNEKSVGSKHDQINLQARVVYLGTKKNKEPRRKHKKESKKERASLALTSDNAASNESLVSGGSSASDETIAVDEAASVISEMDKTSTIIEPEKQIEPLVVPDLIRTVFDKLMAKEFLTYEEYLDYYKELNHIIEKPLGPVLMDESPIVYYIGDTHGSYDEAINLIRYFEQVLLKHPDYKIIFLGDYVDRNPFDLETLTVLTAFYLQHQNNVVLLRGNHEDITINKAYGFIRNLNENFIIPDRVEAIYELILTFFIHLPIVHIHTLKNSTKSIKVFATHGGIPVNLDDPTTPVKIEEIKDKISVNVKSYNDFDPYLSWLLWADPKEDIQGIIYDPQSGRSQFGPDAFRAFMDANNYDFMVRAHERWPDGYHFFFNYCLVSLFTTSFYNGKRVGNAAFIRLEPGKSPIILSTDPKKLDDDLQGL
jgi:hypothetical protein